MVNTLKPFWKYMGLALGVQILLLAAAMAITYLSANDSILGVLLVYLYLPTIWLVGALGDFRGESGMINPILYGVPLGILIYSTLTGLLFSYLKRAGS